MAGFGHFNALASLKRLSTCSFWHFHGFVFLAVEATETDTYSCSYSHPALSHQLTVSCSTVGESELKENTEWRHPVCWEVQIPEPSSCEATINIQFFSLLLLGQFTE